MSNLAIPQTDGRRNSNGDILLSKKGSSSQLAPHEETHEENEEYDDETASKGSNDSKKSYDEKVINTNYTDNEKDNYSPTKNQLLRRKSVAPALHSTLTE